MIHSTSSLPPPPLFIHPLALINIVISKNVILDRGNVRDVYNSSFDMIANHLCYLVFWVLEMWNEADMGRKGSFMDS